MQAILDCSKKIYSAMLSMMDECYEMAPRDPNAPVAKPDKPKASGENLKVTLAELSEYDGIKNKRLIISIGRVTHALTCFVHPMFCMVLNTLTDVSLAPFAGGFCWMCPQLGTCTVQAEGTTCLPGTTASPEHKFFHRAPFFQNGLQAKSGFEMCFDIGSRHLRCWGQNTSPHAHGCDLS